MRYFLVGFRFAALVLSALIRVGAEAATDDLDRFELFNECRPMFVLVESLHRQAAIIGLTKGSLASAARSRLRSASLYTEDSSGPYLYVNVHIAEQVFSASVDFMKLVYDRASGLAARAPTWQRSVLGTHGRDAAYVRNVIAGFADEFLDAYLRVNETACENRTRPIPFGRLQEAPPRAIDRGQAVGLENQQRQAARWDWTEGLDTCMGLPIRTGVHCLSRSGGSQVMLR